MLRLTIFIVIFAVLSSLIIADDPCRFEQKGKGVIDISTLARTDGTAAFPDETPSPGANYLFSYNPCKPFTEGDTCKNVAVCQVSRNKEYTFILGTHDSAKWDAGPDSGTNVTISYSFEAKQVLIELNCTDSATSQLDALGERPTNFYRFRLRSKCACWNGCKSADGGISGGAIFIIILLVLAVVYFAGFAIYYRFLQHRTGVDVIAHRTFWVALPVYARDGVIYLFRRVTGKGGLEYQKV